MQKLIDYIRALFRLSGGQAMPTGSISHTYYSDTDTTSHSFVASADGYIQVSASSNTTSNELMIGTSNGVYITSNASTSGWGCFGLYPVKKGQSFNVRGSGMANMSVGHVLTVGGGLIYFLRSLINTGGLCYV
jgi:hypothetical protein